MNEQDYIPFSDEWKREMKKCNKEVLISLLKYNLKKVINHKEVIQAHKQAIYFNLEAEKILLKESKPVNTPMFFICKGRVEAFEETLNILNLSDSLLENMEK